ncbi:MAG TPA: DUF3943 domain-containing protein [Ignavibacteria bacterium]|nr:DUF3943 domain-containing protein [Ignavibacteria bacterium]HMR38967.1 DUF3943 domain-containing protein [Ignavibacteria bacterium]
MGKFLKILFIIILISCRGYAQDNDHIEKIVLKLNHKESGEYSSLKLNSGIFSKKVLPYSFEDSYNIQDPLKNLKKIKINPDNDLNKKYPIWIPVTEVIGLNAGIGSFNAYVSGSEFAKISFKTVATNLEIGAVWDHDHFITNFFAHPYHGNLYFNTARSNGYSFWESAPFSFGGSLMWELFMENEPPATNDLINTTVSGYMLGEILYRSSSLIIDESKTGFARVSREFFAGLLNPMRAFNRILTGKISRVTSKEAFEIEPVYLELSAGTNRILDGTEFFTGTLTAAINFRMVYGNPFKERKVKPFDFFRIQAQLNLGDTNNSQIGAVTAYGTLAGTNLNNDANKDQKIFAGIFQHYDFFDNQVYKVGGISFGAGVITKFPSIIKNSNIVTTLHLNVMPLGAANSLYSAFGEKEYNFSSGLNMKFESYVNFDWGFMGVNYNLYWLHTVIGSASNEYVGLLRPRLEVHLLDFLNIGTEYLFYHREGYYKDYPDVFVRNNEVKLYLGYSFGNFRLFNN